MSGLITTATAVGTFALSLNLPLTVVAAGIHYMMSRSETPGDIVRDPVRLIYENPEASAVVLATAGIGFLGTGFGFAALDTVRRIGNAAEGS
jgi:hypothetical protein